MKRSNGKINFNFTNEQQERFSLLYAETRKIHPHLIEDDILREKTKVILAHYIINEDKINSDLKTTDIMDEFKEIKVSGTI